MCHFTGVKLASGRRSVVSRGNQKPMEGEGEESPAAMQNLRPDSTTEQSLEDERAALERVVQKPPPRIAQHHEGIHESVNIGFSEPEVS